MLVDEKPPLDEDLLEHYGIKGMKWGRRKGKAETGMNRRRSALVDRNDRAIARIKRVQTKSKDATVHDRIGRGIQRMAMGKKLATKYQNHQVAKMTAQNARLKSGKVLVRDRLLSDLTFTPIDLVMSNRPK